MVVELKELTRVLRETFIKTIDFKGYSYDSTRFFYITRVIVPFTAEKENVF